MFTDSAPLLQPAGEAPHWPRDKFYANPVERAKSRQPRTHEAFQQPWAAIDAKLAVAGAPPLGLLEFHAARLYTGPMFVKYNGTCAATSRARGAPAAARVPSPKCMLAFECLSHKRMDAGTLRGLPGKVPMLTKQFESICQGNTYTTT